MKCPVCWKQSLIRKKNGRWKCQNCGGTFKESEISQVKHKEE